MARQNSAGVGTALNVALITVLTSSPVFLPGATGELIREDTGLASVQIGMLLALYWLCSLAGAFISRRRTRRAPTVESCITASVLITATGLAAVAVWPAAGLWFGGATGGVAYGYSQPYTNVLLMRRCRPDIRSLAFGLKQAAVPAAALLCSLGVPLLAVPVGWRTIFALAAVLCVIYVIYALTIRRRKGSASAASQAISAPLALNGHLLALASAGAFGAAVGNSLAGFLITTLSRNGLSLATAGIVAASGAGANIAVRIGAGIAVDRTRLDADRLLRIMFVVGIVGTLLLATSWPPGQTVGAVLAYAGGWGWAGLLHYIAGASYPGQERKATAISQMGVSLGAAMGPLLFGLTLASLGSGAAWITMTIAGGLALASVVAAFQLRPIPKISEHSGGASARSTSGNLPHTEANIRPIE